MRMHPFRITDIGGNIDIDLDHVLAIEPRPYNRTGIYVPGHVFLVGRPFDEVKDLLKAVTPPEGSGVRACDLGEEREELEALRRRVKQLQLDLDRSGFTDFKRRTEALKKARLFELSLLEKCMGEVTYALVVRSYVEHRRAEIEAGDTA